MLTLLDVDPTLAGFGQTAAIIICLFFLVFILVAAAFALVMVFATAWVREKAELIKMLRPTVDSVNQTSEAAIQGQEPGEDKHVIVRTLAKVPAGMHAADRKVDQVTEKVAHGAIEFRARMVQVQTVAKTFLFPKTTMRRDEPIAAKDSMKLDSSGYKTFTKEKALPTTTIPGQARMDGYTTAIGASQLRDAPVR